MVQFFRNCIQYKRILMIIFVVAMAFNYFFVIKGHTDKYLSQTTILVSMQIDELNELSTYEVLQAFQVSEKLVYDIPGIIMSTKVLNDVKQALLGAGLDLSSYSIEDFKKQVTTEILTNTRIVEINVVNNKPAVAQLIAKTVAESTKQMVTDLYKQEYIVIIKSAEYPSNTDGLSSNLLWAVNFIGSFFMGCLGILIITVANNNRS